MPNKIRLLWPDAAKGVAIVLVVLAHLTSKHYATLEIPVPGTVHLFWLGLTGFLEPVRMPLFFAISGYFVSKYMAAPWSAVISRRFLPAYYLYLVWFIIYSLFFLLEPPLRTSSPSNVTEQIVGLFWGYTSLWYLYALPVYFVICRMLAKWPRKALIGAAMLAILKATTLMPELGNSASIIGNLVFFMAAAYFSTAISRLVVNAKRHLVKLAVLLAILSSAMSLIKFISSDEEIELNLYSIFIAGGELALGILGVIVGVKTFSILAERTHHVAPFFAFIGRNTLPIYVLHLMILSLLNIVVTEFSMPFIVAIIYPPIALILTIGLCLTIHRLLLLVKFQWLFKMPNFSIDNRKTEGESKADKRPTTREL